MKASAKVSAATTTTEKTVVVVAIPASIKTLITESASNDAKASLALKASEQSTVKLAQLIGKELAKEDRDGVRAALKPLFTASYTKSGKDEKYAGEQLSRVLTLAFPGGAKATPKAAEKAAKELAKALEANFNTNQLLAVSRGSAKVGTDGKLVPIKKDNRGGSNAKTPLDNFKEVVEAAATAATQAKLDPVAMFNVLIDALKECEAIDEDEAEAIGEAIKENL